MVMHILRTTMNYVISIVFAVETKKKLIFTYYFLRLMKRRITVYHCVAYDELSLCEKLKYQYKCCVSHGHGLPNVLN